MTLFELMAKISLDTSEYDSGLDSASGKASGFASKLTGALGTAGKVAAGVIVGVGSAAASAGAVIVGATNKVASYGDSIDKMSQKMGVSAEKYQEWDAVMRHSGTSMEAMKTGMKTLANAAETGNKAFEKIGLTQDQISKMSQEELFEATISGLQNVESTTERTYLAGKLLGRGATELGALLNTSAEDTQQMKDRVHELGGVMSDEAVKASAAYKDSMQDLQTSMQGLVRNATSEFLPSMTTVMDGLASVFAGESGGQEKITEGINGIIKTVGTTAPKFMEKIGTVASGIMSAINSNLPAITNAVLNGAISAATSLVGAIPSFLSSAATILGTVISTIWSRITSTDWIGLGKTVLDGIINGIKSATSKIQTAIKGVGKSASNSFKNINWGEAGKKAITLLVSALKAAGKLIGTVLKSVGKIGITAFKAVNWKGVGKAVITFIGGAIRGAGSLVLNALKSAGTKALNAFKSLSWVQLGSNIVSGIVRGIGGAAGSLFNKLRSLASDALSAAKRALKIGSPSKLFRDEVGKQIPAGMAIGIQKGSKYVSKAMDNLNALTMSSIPDYELGDSGGIPNVASPNDEPYATIEMPDGNSDNRPVKNVNVYNYITVDGAKDPEEYTERLDRSIRQEVRMA